MNRIIFVILFFFLYSEFSFGQTTSCSDSVKITYYHHEDDNSEIYSNTIDSFDLDSGIVNSCVSSGTSLGTMGGYNCTVSYWNKKSVTYNLQGDTLELLTLTGSATGWQNYSRSVYSYDAVTGFKLSQSDENWNGTSWEQQHLHSWFFNASNLLIEESDQNIQAGVIDNNSRILWNYTGNILDSKLVQNGNGTNWVNSRNYIFSYDLNGTRDSVTYQTWDSVNSVWYTIGTSPYYISGLKLADFFTLKTVVINGTPLIDSAFFTIDTLENTIYYYDLMPASYSSSMGYFYNKTIGINSYINNKLLNIYSHNSEWFDDGFGLGWYCTSNDLESVYDSAAYLIQTIQNARCVMPNTYTTDYFFNTNHILIKETGYLDSGTRTDYYNSDFYYSGPDSLIAVIAPMYNPNYYLCYGNVINPFVQAAGGCGTYHYSWSPSTGLSSDTIPDPYITVGDSVDYTITIHDSNGHVAVTHFYSQPYFEVELTLDTAPCAGCPAVLNATHSQNYTYQWYLNGNLLNSSNTSSLQLLATGYYYVVASMLNLTCSAVSDSIFYLYTSDNEINKNELISLSPNPSNGLSQLKNCSTDNEFIRVSINSIAGADDMILFEGFSDRLKDITLDAGQYSPGIYVVSVYSEMALRRILWVVER